MQVIHTVAFNTADTETLFFDDSHHFYHCSNTNHSWPVFFNGAVPVPYPEEEQVLETCTTVTTDDMFRKRLIVSRKAMGVDPDDLSTREDAAPVKELYMKLADATRRVWVLSDVMQSIVKYETAYVHIMKEHRLVIGIQARGGDKLQEQKGYATQLAALLAGGPSAFAAVRRDLGEEKLAGSLCIVVGDDVAVAESMAKVAADALGCLIMNRAIPGPERSAHDAEAFNASPLAHRCYAAQRIIADVEVLAAADIFVGARLSNVASLVAGLRRFVYNKSKATEYDLYGSVLKPF